MRNKFKCRCDLTEGFGISWFVRMKLNRFLLHSFICYCCLFQPICQMTLTGISTQPGVLTPGTTFTLTGTTLLLGIAWTGTLGLLGMLVGVSMRTSSLLHSPFMSEYWSLIKLIPSTEPSWSCKMDLLCYRKEWLHPSTF